MSLRPARILRLILAVLPALALVLAVMSMPHAAVARAEATAAHDCCAPSMGAQMADCGLCHAAEVADLPVPSPGRAHRPAAPIPRAAFRSVLPRLPVPPPRRGAA